MLTKLYRLRKKNDFKQVTAQGQSLRGDFLVLKWRRNELDVCRLATVVSLKVSKKAVYRNKVKRRLRAIFKENQERINNYFDIVLIAQPKIQNKDYQEIKLETEALFKKAKII